ncbi:ImmA/IrrE family metallo-endopeptidase [Cryobacterium sp. MDB1-18-2]|uniref:ImmA/IrrE family metallo-endopeptidase n=1 Tax=unclassified Cryobacterium TaxID=2649013 RepID=UPI00106D290D|nr:MULTISPECIES: ImmA/IrrE family metallo-endopeptidase [unclassified Cryobacterium]TFC22092.1 ImmA/IrrE family metallo-endopeptidase [Cryobacterium sp. MDB1-18-2]TFC40665.1 ImmA/IrrE family metallo-endopeptidase [Cryobacterium sp. MDB1-18-1]
MNGTKALTDYAVPTGDFVAEWLEENELSQAELSRRLGVSAKHVSKLIGGAPMTPDMATKLALVTGVPARLWLGYEATYRADVSRLGLAELLVTEKPLAMSFPLAHLRKLGFVTATIRRPGEVVVELFAFFGVASADALRRCTEKQAIAFRQGLAHPVDIHALATWLRLGELEAAATREDLPQFSPQHLEALIPELRALSAEPPHDFGERLVLMLHAAGVQLIFVPEVTGARVFGATRWIRGNPVVALTLRGRNDGQFWFTLLHEIGHVLLHPGDETHVRAVDQDSDGGDLAEREANDFAGNTLIPVERGDELRALKTKSQVMAFAMDIGVSPGIVVGRLWHDQIWHYSMGHDLCLKLGFKDD